VQEAEQPQETKQQKQPQTQHTKQPSKPRPDAKTYAGRIGTRNTPAGYYRQPRKVTPGGGEYQRREKEGGGRGRGRGGKGRGGRGGQAGQAQEFRPISKDPTPSLFVSNLPDGANENSVADLFKKFGNVKSVDFPSDKNFCFVHFESQDGVETAMSTEDDLLWDDYAVWYEPKRLATPKGASRGNGGQKVSSGEKKKQNPAIGKSDGKQPQQPKQGGGKQQSQSQSQNQQDGDGQGPWQNVAYRRREKKGDKKNEKTDKKNEKKNEKKFEKKSDKK
jgi:RNA recognition motif-containing protein